MSPSQNHAESDSETQTRVDFPVVSHILTPGSSIHPTFLLIVDGVFVFLLLVLIALLYVTGGNPHFFVLICLSLALWASVKWFVNELRQASLETNPQEIKDTSTQELKKDR